AIQADVGASAPVAPCARHQALGVAPGDSFGGGHAAAKLASAEPPGLGRHAGDRREQDDSDDAAIAAPARVVEHLVGAGRMPGQHDAPIAAFTNEGEDRPDVLDAVDEALVGRPGHSPTAAGDDVVAARVELAV